MMMYLIDRVRAIPIFTFQYQDEFAPVPGKVEILCLAVMVCCGPYFSTSVKLDSLNRSAFSILKIIHHEAFLRKQLMHKGLRGSLSNTLFLHLQSYFSDMSSTWRTLASKDIILQYWENDVSTNWIKCKAALAKLLSQHTQRAANAAGVLGLV